MQKNNNATIKKWVDVWKQAGLSLKNIKRKELQSEDYYQKNKALLNKMLQYAFDNRKIKLTSGLVEQQKIFMKNKSSKNENRVGKN